MILTFVLFGIFVILHPEAIYQDKSSFINISLGSILLLTGMVMLFRTKKNT